MSTGAYSPDKALAWPDRIEALKRGEQIYPVHVQIILSDLCDLDCPTCAYRMSGYSSNQLFNGQKPDGSFTHNPNRMLEAGLVRQIIDDSVTMGTRALQFSVLGDELIPVVGPDGRVSVREIGEFVDTAFETPNPTGIHQEKSIKGLGHKSFAINDSGEVVLGEIEAVYRHRAIESLYEVVLEDGRSIRVTGSHSLNAIRDGEIRKVPVSQLQIGDPVACANWRAPQALPRSFPTPRNDHHAAKQINNEVTPSAELFRLLGYFTAEGSTVSENRSMLWCFGNGPREEEYRADALRCIETVFGITGALLEDGSGALNRVALHSTRAVAFFAGLGVLGVQMDRRIPTIVWPAPNEWKIQYLVGLFSGDGNFRATIDSRGFRRNSMHLATCNRGLAHEVMALLHQLGVAATLKTERTKVRFVGDRRLEPTNKFTVNVYAAEGLEILAPVVAALGATPVYRTNSPYSSRGSRRKPVPFGKEAQAIKIKSIRQAEELGRPIVYDITVAGTHRFLTVSGIGAANTGGGEPTIHPHAKELIEYAQARGLDTALVTNGLHLDRLGDTALRTKWLRVSVDAATPDTYAIVRPSFGGRVERSRQNFAKVLAALEKAVARRDQLGTDCVIGAGFVVQEANWRELAHFVRVFRDVGVDNVRISGAFTPKGDAYHAGYREEALALETEARALATDAFRVYARFAEKLDDLASRPDYKDCWYQQFTTYIGGDGNLYRCCVQSYNRHGLLGNVKEAGGFKALWDSEAKKAKISGFDARSCGTCQFNDRNRSIDTAIRSDPAPVLPDMVHKGFV